MTENSSESTEPDDHQQNVAQAQTQNFYEEIVTTFKNERIVFKVFETIPEGIFPCKFGTQSVDYKSKFSFITLFDPKKFDAGEAKKGFEELTQTIYPHVNTHPVIVTKKWINHPVWKNPEGVYRATFGQCATEDSELIQIFFCNQRNFEKFAADFDGLYFLKQ